MRFIDLVLVYRLIIVLWFSILTLSIFSHDILSVFLSKISITKKHHSSTTWQVYTERLIFSFYHFLFQVENFYLHNFWCLVGNLHSFISIFSLVETCIIALFFPYVSFYVLSYSRSLIYFSIFILMISILWAIRYWANSMLFLSLLTDFYRYF